MSSGLSVEAEMRYRSLLEKDRRDPTRMKRRLPPLADEIERSEVLMRKAELAILRHDLRGGRPRRAALHRRKAQVEAIIRSEEGRLLRAGARGEITAMR